MNIKSLTVNNFRNYNKQIINFKNGLNVLEGANAQGKTNLLEAIFLCSIGKATRTNKVQELIKMGEDCANVKLNFSTIFGDKEIEIIIPNSQNKTININGISIKKIGELMQNFNAVYFSPDELKIVKEGPQERRKFMDISISQLSKTYFYLLQRYENAIEQRNRLLKNTKDINVFTELACVWDEQLADIGSKIIFTRRKFVDKLSVFAKQIHSDITNNKENLILTYQGASGQDLQTIKKNILNELKNNYEKDFAIKFTSFGPHRDDIKIIINNIDVRSMGSQGQKRTVALSMKLAEMEIMKEEVNEYPVLLLDDVLSELDKSRQEKLLSYASKVQTILTCTNYEENTKPSAIFKVMNGEIKSI